MFIMTTTPLNDNEKNAAEVLARCVKRLSFLESFFSKHYDVDSFLGDEALSDAQIDAVRASQAVGAFSKDIKQLHSYFDSRQVKTEAVQPVPTQIAGLGTAKPATPASKTVTLSPTDAAKKQALLQKASDMSKQSAEAQQRVNEQLEQQQRNQQALAATREQERVQREQQLQQTRAVEQERREAIRAAIPTATSVSAAKPQVADTIDDKGRRHLSGVARVLTAYERLMSEHSPLYLLFAPSPWFPQGRGALTVGSSKFGDYHPNFTPDVTNWEATSRLPSGFYGNADGLPTHAVIRLHTTMLVWDFKFGPENMYIFHSVMNPTPEDNKFRAVSTCTTSTLRRVLIELNEAYGVSVNATVVE